MSDEAKQEATIEDFFTRESGNAGTKIYLAKPDGTETESWIRILSIDSDAYRRAESRMRRELYSNPLLEVSDRVKDASEAVKKRLAAEREAVLEEHTQRLIAALIADWSLATECTDEAKFNLVVEAPQIADRIEQVSRSRELFAKKKPLDSLKSPESNSKSTGRSKAEKPQLKAVS